MCLPLAHDAVDTHADSDEKKHSEYDMMDEGSGAHEEVDLRHAEEPEDEAHKEKRQLTDGLNQEKVDEKLQDFVITLKPLHTDGIALYVNCTSLFEYKCKEKR